MVRMGRMRRGIEGCEDLVWILILIHSALACCTIPLYIIAFLIYRSMVSCVARYNIMMNETFLSVVG